MITQSDTPETDHFYCNPPENETAYQFTRQLERQRNDLRRLLEKTRRQLELALDKIVKVHDTKQSTRETPDKLD